MSKKKTHEEFVKEVYDLVGDEYTILGEYKTAKIKVLIKHNCNNEYYVVPSDFLNGSRCPKCSKKKVSHEHFEKLVNRNKESKNFEIIGHYINYKTKIKCKCKIDNYEWYANPTNLISGTGCPSCKNKNKGKHKLSNNEFLKRLYEIGNDVIILEKYNGIYSKIECKCNICNYIWKTTPQNLLRGCACPNCNKSKGENKIKEIFILHNILFESQKTFSNLFGLGNGLLSYDFYLPQQNILIEYQGEFHDGKAKFSSNKKLIKQKEHDKRKKQYAIDNNIELLEIWYWDFDKIENILKEKLKFKENK